MARHVLDPSDEYPHQPEEASNYNESMYFNAFDHTLGMGGWFRLGNRVNEGYAEMSCCVYLPDGRVGFMFGRPRISTNDAMDAGGLRFEVVTPFEALRVDYEGSVCLLDQPTQMADPRRAFAENPHVPCTVALEYRGVGPVYGGRPADDDRTAGDDGFARAHYEQHVAARGAIAVGDEVFTVDALGLRDKSWGPRHWQAIDWYRWIPLNFDAGFAMALSKICRDGAVRDGGVVLIDGQTRPVRAITVATEWTDELYQRRVRLGVDTDDAHYDVDGEVVSLIPLRNRRTTPDGESLHTRITEAMTRFTCDDRVGWGMTEYLDQLVDGRPLGIDAA